MYSPEQTTPPALEEVMIHPVVAKREIVGPTSPNEESVNYELSFNDYEYDMYLEDLHNCNWDKADSHKLASLVNTGYGFEWDRNYQTFEDQPLKSPNDNSTRHQTQRPTTPTTRSDLVTYELSFTDYEYDMYLKDLQNWDKADTLKLTSLVSTYGFDWEKVSQSFEDPAKTPESCTARYNCLIEFLRRKNPQFFQLSATYQQVPTGIPTTAATANPTTTTHSTASTAPSLSSGLGSFIANKNKRKANEISMVNPNKPAKNKSESYDSSDANSKKKRSRRTASEIERNYKCSIPNCLKAYGSEGALKMHIKLKHPLMKGSGKSSGNPSNGTRNNWGNTWTAVQKNASMF